MVGVLGRGVGVLGRGVGVLGRGGLEYLEWEWSTWKRGVGVLGMGMEG